GERTDALELLRVPDGLAAGSNVGEPLAALAAADARDLIGDVAQAGGLGALHRIDIDGHCEAAKISEPVRLLPDLFAKLFEDCHGASGEMLVCKECHIHTRRQGPAPAAAPRAVAPSASRMPERPGEPVTAQEFARCSHRCRGAGMPMAYNLPLGRGPLCVL